MEIRGEVEEEFRREEIEGQSDEGRDDNGGGVVGDAEEGGNEEGEVNLEEEMTGGTGARGSERRETKESEARQLEVDGDVARAREMFTTTFIQYAGTNPLVRPRVPRLPSSRKLARTVELVNRHILPDYLGEAKTLEGLQTIMYVGSCTVALMLGRRLATRDGRARQQSNRMPWWERRLEKRIQNLRKSIGHLTLYISGRRSKKVVRSVEQLLRDVKQHARDEPNATAEDCLDTLRQRLSVLANRLARYRKSKKRRVDNATFKTDQKAFYRGLAGKRDGGEEAPAPSAGDLEDFWGGLWSGEVAHGPDGLWMEEERRLESVNGMEFPPVTREEVASVVARLHNWKAPGPDGLQNFWIKRFTALHEYLAAAVDAAIRDPGSMPRFLLQGVTYLVPKGERSANPAKYRPITCLSTLYKVVTACLASRICHHCLAHNILTEQQKGCSKNSRGCKEQLVIDSTIMCQARTFQRNLHTSFIDYQKAFDSVPHSWLIRVLEVYKVADPIVGFLKASMAGWNTTLCLSTGDREVRTKGIPIKRGIFQGDSLSPLWFCLALNPLSVALNNSGYGYEIRGRLQGGFKLNHLLYMDDIKLYASTEVQLRGLMRMVETFSGCIHMKFGLDKCRTQSVVRGRQMVGGGFIMEDGGRGRGDGGRGDLYVPGARARKERGAYQNQEEVGGSLLW